VSEDVLIRAEGVSKKFCRTLRRSLRYGLQDVVCELAGKSRHSHALRPDEFWSLKDVSFELRRGECIALLGRNGAGKSTLLQLLGGRFKLDEGRITLRAHTGLVTELGAGFNPVQTGRENVYNGGAILGMSRERIDEVYGDIVEFAELQDAMETPVQSYSTGMRARLGYAVAAHLRPDVLLADEVLAVGDIAFRRKCLQHMVRYVKHGGTLVLVAHDMYALQSICERTILLDHGRVLFDGASLEGFNLYYEMLNRAQPAGDEGVALAEGWKPHAVAATHSAEGPPEGQPSGAGNQAGEPRQGQPSAREPVVIESVTIRSNVGGELCTGQDAIVELRYRSRERFTGVEWAFHILTKERSLRIACGVLGIDERPIQLDAGAGVLSCRIRKLPLRPGTYALLGAIVEPDSKAALAELGRLGSPTLFTVKSDVSRIGNLHAYLGDLVALEIARDEP
jgi:ABC-type polysaccharide/polyol phosphate transport system ATPase subunit